LKKTVQHIRSLETTKLSRPSLVTIGVFDGVHRGHQHLIGQMVSYAQSHDLLAVALTFYPYPEMVIRGFQPGYYLTLPDVKAKLLGELDIDVVVTLVTLPFDDRVRQIRAADFVDSLITHLNMQALWVGADFALGYQREGNVAFLQEQGKLRGFDLRVVDSMDAGGERISSSRIRAELKQGNVQEAARLLGRPYRIAGEVVGGAKRGHSIVGIPTANLATPEEQAVPARGVYAGFAYVEGKPWPAVVNIGMRPTFDGQESSIVIEAHLLDFSADIYGQEMELAFIARLRDEQTFDGVAELLAQIHSDIASARELLSEYSHEQ
jgi:riboflavin kinase/FMN adenylyltransferase